MSVDAVLLTKERTVKSCVCIHLLGCNCSKPSNVGVIDGFKGAMKGKKLFGRCRLLRE